MRSLFFRFSPIFLFLSSYLFILFISYRSMQPEASMPDYPHSPFKLLFQASLSSLSFMSTFSFTFPFTFTFKSSRFTQIYLSCLSIYRSIYSPPHTTFIFRRLKRALFHRDKKDKMSGLQQEGTDDPGTSRKNAKKMQNFHINQEYLDMG